MAVVLVAVAAAVDHLTDTRAQRRLHWHRGGWGKAGAMDGQFTSQVRAWNGTQSLHYTFGGASAFGQVTLFMQYDYDDWAVPISHAIASWTNVETTGGSVTIDPLSGTFAANGLTDAQGLLIADNCHAGAVVNFFFWPSV